MIKDKQQIIAELNDSFNSLVDICTQVKHEQFNISKEGKWSAGENIQHLVNATKMTNVAFNLPKFVHVLLYGKPHRTSHGYSKVIDNYLKQLEHGAKASGPYIPKKRDYQRELLQQRIKAQGNKLIAAIHNKWTEEQLDKYVIKHPILGLLTLRELAYFTIYHNSHHAATIKQHYL
mgnify:CR=1 FL=1